jgi:hypothetical protein
MIISGNKQFMQKESTFWKDKQVQRFTFETVTVMLMKAEIFWDYTACRVVHNYRH